MSPDLFIGVDKLLKYGNTGCKGFPGLQTGGSW